MSTGHTPACYPFKQDHALKLSPVYELVWSRNEPITRVKTAAGDAAWLVTGYEESRVLFADSRLGRTHPDPDNAPRISDSVMFGRPLENYDTERTFHAKLRRVLMQIFSPRKMRALTTRVDSLVNDMFDAIAKQGPPADLRADLSFPLPVYVIGELLGVPETDYDDVLRWSQDIPDVAKPERAAQAHSEFVEYMLASIVRKRRNPGDDALSVLAATHDADLADDDLAMVAANIFFGGHETTASRIEYGTLLLLMNPEQRARLQEDATLAASATEEIFRLSAPGDHGFPRWAHTDVEIANVTIRAGEAVILNPVVANQDSSAFFEPEAFDVTRDMPRSHLAFGHGPTFCAGAGLARVQLQSVFGKILARFPGLRLAVAFEELRVSQERHNGGLIELPVEW